MSGVFSFGRYAPTVNVGGSRRLFLVNISNASYLSLVKRLFRFGNKKNPQQRYEQYLKKGGKQQKNQTVFLHVPKLTTLSPAVFQFRLAGLQDYMRQQWKRLIAPQFHPSIFSY